MPVRPSEPEELTSPKEEEASVEAGGEQLPITSEEKSRIDSANAARAKGADALLAYFVQETEDARLEAKFVSDWPAALNDAFEKNEKLLSLIDPWIADLVTARYVKKNHQNKIFPAPQPGLTAGNHDLFIVEDLVNGTKMEAVDLTVTQRFSPFQEPKNVNTIKINLGKATPVYIYRTAFGSFEWYIRDSKAPKDPLLNRNTFRALYLRMLMDNEAKS